MKKKQKRLLKRISGFLGRYINGSKGAVSLFLVLVISPLLSVSVLLVESARYQSAVQLMEEIVDSSAFSSLADYDSYLDKRFGLLSVSQENDINTSFSTYLNENVSALGDSVTVDSQSATGKYSLASTDILKQQVLEYGEISVAAEIVTEGFDIDELLKNFKNDLGLKEINEEIDAVTAGVELATEVEKLLDAIKDAQEQYDDEYLPALTEYGNAYTDFEEKAIALIEAIEEAEANLKEDDAHADIYNDSDVKDAIKALEKSRDKYKEAASTLKSELSTLKGYIETIMSALDNIPSKLDKLDGGSSDSTLASESTYDWLKTICDQLTTELNITVGADFKDTAAGEISLLKDQITELGDLDEDTIKSKFDEISEDTDDITDETRKESRRRTRVQEEYGQISISSVSSSFFSDMEDLIDVLDDQSTVDDDTETQMGNLLDIVSSLLGISGLYDSNLDAVVDSAYLHTNTSLAFSDEMSIASIKDLVTACEDFKEGITSFNVIQAVKGLVTLLKAVVEFLASIVTWFGKIAVNIVTLAGSEVAELYNTLLLYGYGAYNLPNRTNYNSGKTLSGYSYKNIYELGGGVSASPTITGALEALADIGETEGTDRMFKGAEAEYILVGSTSELQNQSVAFFNLYMLRLLLDLAPVLTNSEVSQMATAAGPGAWVVKLAIALAEPMLDCIILVNGGKEYLFNKTVYLSPSGISTLLKDLNNITSLSTTLKNRIKNTIGGSNKTETKTEDNSNTKKTTKQFCNATYAEHMLILTMLSVNQTTFMQRLQNLIQMETAANYKDSFEFDLDQAYTYIYTDVSYTLNPMFNIDSLTDNGLFSVTIQRYSGY